MLLARHKNESKMFAIKVLQKQAIMKRNEVKHIMSERNVLLKNIKHPFLVGLHYSFQTQDKLYFVLDYVNGGEVSRLFVANVYTKKNSSIILGLWFCTADNCFFYKRLIIYTTQSFFPCKLPNQHNCHYLLFPLIILISKRKSGIVMHSILCFLLLVILD